MVTAVLWHQSPWLVFPAPISQTVSQGHNSLSIWVSPCFPKDLFGP